LVALDYPFFSFYFQWLFFLCKRGKVSFFLSGFLVSALPPPPIGFAASLFSPLFSFLPSSVVLRTACPVSPRSSSEILFWDRHQWVFFTYSFTASVPPAVLPHRVGLLRGFPPPYQLSGSCPMVMRAPGVFFFFFHIGAPSERGFALGLTRLLVVSSSSSLLVQSFFFALEGFKVFCVIFFWTISIASSCPRCRPPFFAPPCYWAILRSDLFHSSGTLGHFFCAE